MEAKGAAKRILMFLFGMFLILVPCLGYTAIPLNLPFDVQYYLGMKVGTDPEVTPRRGLTSVGYAYGAQTVEPVVAESSGTSYRLSAGFWPGIMGPPSPMATASATPTGAVIALRTPKPSPTGVLNLVVNSTDDVDDGTCNATHCSLREALNAAAVNTGADTISFNIPPTDPGCDVSGVCTIQPLSLLPFLSDGGTTIDGYSQPGASPGANPVLKIVLDGYNNGSFSGLSVRSANNVIRGLVIQRFTPFSGVHIEGATATGNHLEGNFFGTDATGTQSRGNCSPPVSCAAIWIQDGAQNNIIGPDNLIAFNGRGVWVADVGTVGNTITRNRIHDNQVKGIWLFDGGNGGIAPPVITTASVTQVSGTACANCTVEVFSDAADEGAIYEGTTTANTSGNWTFSKPGGLSGPYVTATATDGSSNTSEFSAPGSIPIYGIVDFDRDGKTDIAVYHSASGLWFINPSSGAADYYVGYGGSGYVPAPGDYDGDGKTDIAVYHSASGLWFIKKSSNSTSYYVGYGGSGYVPVPGDYDGDRKTDIAVYHSASGLWFIKPSSGAADYYVGYGGSDYVPVPGDYDGDTKTDVAAYHSASGLWFIKPSSGAADYYVGYGGSGYTPVNIVYLHGYVY